MRIVFKKQFMRDIEKARNTHLLPKIKRLIAIVSKNPFQNPPPYEKLRGYEHTYSRRINEQHRLLYSLKGEDILLEGCWGHYE